MKRKIGLFVFFVLFIGAKAWLRVEHRQAERERKAAEQQMLTEAAHTGRVMKEAITRIEVHQKLYERGSGVETRSSSSKISELEDQRSRLIRALVKQVEVFVDLGKQHEEAVAREADQSEFDDIRTAMNDMTSDVEKLLDRHTRVTVELSQTYDATASHVTSRSSL